MQLVPRCMEQSPRLCRRPGSGREQATGALPCQVQRARCMLEDPPSAGKQGKPLHGIVGCPGSDP